MKSSRLNPVKYPTDLPRGVQGNNKRNLSFPEINEGINGLMFGFPSVTQKQMNL
jgi:hypothetical protein